MLYKMDLLCIDECLYSVVNIRMNLDHHKPTARQRKTMRRVESRFTVTYGHAQPNANKEALYDQHKSRFKGFIHNTLTDYLSAGFQGPFLTRERCACTMETNSSPSVTLILENRAWRACLGCTTKLTASTVWEPTPPERSRIWQAHGAQVVLPRLHPRQAFRF